MAKFKGMMGQTHEALHVITTKDPYFRSIGLVNFTSGQLWEALKNNVALNTDPNGAPTGRSQQAVWNQIMTSEDANFMHMDDASKETTRLELTSYLPLANSGPFAVDDLIGLNRDWASGLYQTDTHPEECKLLKHVKTGRGGYVQWSGGPPTAGGAAASGSSASGQLTAGLYIDFTPDVTATPSGWASGVPHFPSGQSGIIRAGQNKCVKGFHPTFQVRLFDGSRARNSDRSMVGNGPPTFVAMPKTNFGKPYNWRGTDNDGTPPGQFADLEEGGDSNPSNMVGGELDVAYNRNTGKFEAGTIQCIARLLDDIAAAPLLQFPEGNVDLLTQDCFMPSSDQYTGFFATGRATPMSVHHGNPYTFGPTWKGKKCKKDEKEILIAVNRAQRDYKAGETVMLNKIDGEWIILPMGEIDVVTPGMFGIQQWSFSSFIANSNGYFRDNRYEEKLWTKAGAWGHWGGTIVNEDVHFMIPGGSNSQSGGSVNLTAQEMKVIKTADYEDGFRREFFYSMFYDDGSMIFATPGFAMFPSRKAKDAALNLGYNVNGLLTAIAKGKAGLPVASGAYIRTNMVGALNGYHQTSNFDMVSKAFGGVNTRTILGQQNHDMKCGGQEQEKDDDGTIPGWQMYPFWGPMFKDGYRTVQLDSIRNKTVDIVPCGPTNAYFFNANLPSLGAGDGKSIINMDTDANMMGGPFSWVESDASGVPLTRKLTTSNEGLQLPADIALNASPSGLNGRPMEDLLYIQAWSNVDTRRKDLFERMKYMFKRVDRFGNVITGSGSQARFTWLADPSGFDSVNNHDNPSTSTYDLRPLSPEKISFYPATVEWVASTDPHTFFGPRSDEQLYGGQKRFPWVPVSYQQHWQNARKNWLGGGGAGEEFKLNGYTSPLPGFTFLNTPDVGMGNLYDIIPQRFFQRNQRARLHGNKLLAQDSTGKKLYPLKGLAWQGGHSIDVLPWDYRVMGKSPNKYYPGTMDYYKDNANVVSIVASKVRIRARASELVFMTEQFLGVNVHATVSAGGTVVGTFIGFLFGGLSATGPGPQTNSHPQWGYVPDNVESFGTTALHGRLFDQWPDEQTVYDPRYFAVHHFNPGTADEVIKSWAMTSRTVFWEPDPATNGSGNLAPDDSINVRFRHTDGSLDTTSFAVRSKPKGKWMLGAPYPHFEDAVIHGVDHREPTWGPLQTGPNGGFSMGRDGLYGIPGEHVFGVQWDGGNGIYSMRPTGDWNISNTRRGMLLSNGGFKHHRRTIGAGDLEYIDVSSGDPLTTPQEGGAWGADPHDGIDAGYDFQVNDFLEFYGGSGKGARLQVTAVERNRRTGKGNSSKGAIKYDGGQLALKYVLAAGDIEERGADYKGEDFPAVKGNLVPEKGASYTVKLLPTDTQSNGKFSGGREPRLRAGKIIEKVYTDLGPSERGNLAQLSLGSNNGNGNTMGWSGQPNGRTKGTRQISYNIASEGDQKSIFDQGNQGTVKHKTPVGSYDAFLYFHSDVGHISNHGGGLMNAQQNYINLQITTQ